MKSYTHCPSELANATEDVVAQLGSTRAIPSAELALTVGLDEGEGQRGREDATREKENALLWYRRRCERRVLHACAGPAGRIG